MNKKPVLTTAFISVLLFSALVGIYFASLTAANFTFPPLPRIYIRSNGSVNPSTAPIKRVGEVYTFTGNISNYVIEVQCSNIIIDGAGYTIQVMGSMQDEKGIILTGRSNVTIKNIEIKNFMVGISVNSSSNNIISGNNIIRNAVGIRLYDQSRNNIISENHITSNGKGISIYYSGNNVLRNNFMNNRYNFWVDYEVVRPTSDFVNDIDASNTVNGKPICYWVNQRYRTVSSDVGYVALINCTGITVQNLNLAHNGQGILLVSTTNSIITKNNITSNWCGIHLYGGSNNNVITKNNIISNDKAGDAFYGVSLRESHNNKITKNIITNHLECIDLFNSQGAEIIGNTITGNGKGIYFSGTSNSVISGNNITDNTYGIYFSGASSNVISGNNIAKNAFGIVVDDSVKNRIIRNMITENRGWGIRFIKNQRNNVIYHNNFINNNVGEGLQVSMPWPAHANIWDNGKEGNYWSDYRTRYPNATEIGGSGIGDTPFFINENNIDRYPLMDPAVIPGFTDRDNPTPILIAVSIVLAIILGAAFYRKRKH